jgi:hypothetical protein
MPNTGWRDLSEVMERDRGRKRRRRTRRMQKLE